MIDNLQHQGLRHRMVDYLNKKRGISSPDVLRAMNIVPRHLFLDSSFLVSIVFFQMKNYQELLLLHFF